MSQHKRIFSSLNIIGAGISAEVIIAPGKNLFTLYLLKAIYTIVFTISLSYQHHEDKIKYSSQTSPVNLKQYIKQVQWPYCFPPTASMNCSSYIPARVTDVQTTRKLEGLMVNLKQTNRKAYHQQPLTHPNIQKPTPNTQNHQ